MLILKGGRSIALASGLIQIANHVNITKSNKKEDDIFIEEDVI